MFAHSAKRKVCGGKKMETAKTEKQQPKVTFENCKTIGDHIKALVREYTDNAGSTFILSEALRQVKINDQKVTDFKEKLFAEAD